MNGLSSVYTLHSNPFLRKRGRHDLDTYLVDLDPSKIWEVVIREKKANKTMAQLKGLFGVWVNYIADVESKSKPEVHKELKAGFLARIYFTNPTGLSQTNWVEKLGLLQELGRGDEVLKEANKISLKWASLPQMKLYMSSIEEHYQSTGMPLPVLDKSKRK